MAAWSKIKEFRRDGQIPVGNGSFCAPCELGAARQGRSKRANLQRSRRGHTCQSVARHGMQQYLGQRGSWPLGRQVERIIIPL